MTRRLTAVLLAVALLVAVGIVVGAKAVVGDSAKVDHPKAHRTPQITDSALYHGQRFAAVVNERSRQQRHAMRLTAVHCAHDPASYACSFRQRPGPVCRFIRFTDYGGRMEILLTGLVPMTFCQPGTGVG